MARRSPAGAKRRVSRGQGSGADACPFSGEGTAGPAKPRRAGKHTDARPSSDLAAYDAVFTALAHEQRRQVLLVLNFRGGEMTAGDIAGRFACTWPTTTRHLRILEEAGLVIVKKRGRERVYRLNKQRLNAVAGAWLKWFA